MGVVTFPPIAKGRDGWGTRAFAAVRENGMEMHQAEGAVGTWVAAGRIFWTTPEAGVSVT